MTNASQSIPDGSVVITPTEMFRELRDTHDEVKKVSQNVETLTTNVVSRVEDHEVRLRGLERWRWQFGGAVIILAAASSYAVSFLVAR